MKQESVDYILKTQREKKTYYEALNKYTEVQLAYMPIVLCYNKGVLEVQEAIPTVFHIENNGLEDVKPQKIIVEKGQSKPKCSEIEKPKKIKTEKAEQIKTVKEDEVNCDGQISLF